MSTLPPEDPSDLDTLFRRWQRDQDAEAREALTRRFLPLAHKLAHRYARSSEPLEDLRQVASLALLKAIDRFDPERANGFAAFATPTILGELKRHFRDAGWSVHVPRGVQERVAEIQRATERLTINRGRPPTAQEIADELELSIEEVLDGLNASHAYDTSSLDAPAGRGGEDPRPVSETLGADDERYELIEADVTIASAVGALSARERQILHLRFSQEMTQSEIAARLGVSQMQVSRLLRRALSNVRERAEG